MVDLLIIGAGPAGLAAAISAAENEIKVVLVDEFIKPGGRLLGQLHQEPDGSWVNGIHEAQVLLNKANNLGVEILCGVSVYDLIKFEEHWCVYTTEKIIEAKIVLLATGASETPIPISGWTLPGVMSIGAAQVMGNVHRVKPGNNGVIVGVNVLSVAIARELQLCGVNVKGILLPQSNILSEEHARPVRVMEKLLGLAHLAPSAFIRMGSKFVNAKTAAMFFPKSGVKMWDIPIQVKQVVTEIVGKETVEGVRVSEIDMNGNIIPNKDKFIEADFVCIAGGLTPLAELASVAGCEFYAVPQLGGYIPLHSESMQTNVKGLYVAGNITGIESAKVAKAQGYVAGIAISRELNPNVDPSGKNLEQAMSTVKKTRQEALIQFNEGIEEAREEIYGQFKQNKKSLAV